MPDWQVATLIRSTPIATNVRSLIFAVDAWREHVSGQHYSIRLTAPDGYRAQRDYSVASPPERAGVLEFGIELIPGGEVSPYLHQMPVGEQVELLGPIGGHFNWDVSMPGPLVLIGGGSGLVPLMSMIRHHLHHLGAEDSREVYLLVSARTKGHVLYWDELQAACEQDPNFNPTFTLTREAPADWDGFTGRIGMMMLEELHAHLKDKMPMIYVCGPTPFVEAVAGDLVGLGFSSHQIRTERFGGISPS
jgi:ferredoxin-NADP reductase